MTYCVNLLNIFTASQTGFANSHLPFDFPVPSHLRISKSSTIITLEAQSKKL